MICRLKIRKPALRDKDCGVDPTRRAAFIGSALQVIKLHKIEIMTRMFNKGKRGNYHEYYNAYHHRRRVGPIVRRGWRLLVEQTRIGITSHIILTQKQNLIKKKRGKSIGRNQWCYGQRHLGAKLLTDRRDYLRMTDEGRYAAQEERTDISLRLDALEKDLNSTFAGVKKL